MVRAGVAWDGLLSPAIFSRVLQASQVSHLPAHLEVITAQLEHRNIGGGWGRELLTAPFYITYVVSIGRTNTATIIKIKSRTIQSFRILGKNIAI